MKKYVDTGLREIDFLPLKLFSKNEIIIEYHLKKKLIDKKYLKK
jgi:hypothetical protein